MSADNWRECPQCRADAEATKEINLDESLREDYELGISDDATFRVSYPIIDFTDAMHRAEIARHERALWKYRHRNQVRLLTLMLAGVALLLVVYLIQR